MIEAEQTVVVNVAIERVWAYVKDMQRWANLMPGMRQFTVINENDSRWTLKVGVGGLVRTVNVNVHVDEWAGPERVTFSYKLDGDPVEGGGSYVASRKGPKETEVTLQARVVGGGPMAPMWEAMGKPLMPQLAKGFALELKDAIEKAASESDAQEPVAVEAPSLLAFIGKMIRNIWRSMFGEKQGQAEHEGRT